MISKSPPPSTSPSGHSHKSSRNVPPHPHKKPPRPPLPQKELPEPPHPHREAPKPPQLAQQTKPKKKRSPEEIEQRKKRVAEKEKAIADLEEKIRNLKLEIEKSKVELSITTKKASIVTKATQTQSANDNQSRVTKMREVFSSNQAINQVQGKILGQVFKYESEIVDYYNKDSQKSNTSTAASNNNTSNVPASPGNVKGKTLPGPPSSPGQLAKSMPATTQKPVGSPLAKSAAAGTSSPASKAGTVKIIRPAPLPPGYDAPQAPNNSPHLKQRSVQRTLSTIIDEKNKISVTFINPKPYAEKNASFTHKFPDKHTYNQVIKEYWEIVRPVISKDIHYDDLRAILEEKNFAVSCTLAQVDTKSLGTLFQIHEEKDSFKELIKKGGFLFSAFGTYFQLCSKTYVSKAVLPGLNCLIEKDDDLSNLKDENDIYYTANGPDKVDPYKSAGYIVSSITVIMDSVIKMKDSIPDEVIAVGNYLWRASKKKFPYVKPNHVGGFIFSRLICPYLIIPERYTKIAEDKSKEKSLEGLKIVTKVINASCSPTFAVRDEFLSFIKDTIVAICDKVRMTFNSFVIPNTDETEDEKVPKDPFKPANTEALESQLRVVQSLMRTHPERFKKILYFYTKVAKVDSSKEDIMKVYDKYVKSGEAKADYQIESTGNFFIMDELPDQEATPEIDRVGGDLDAFCFDTFYVKTQSLSYTLLHPKEVYHVRVHDTDHYISEDSTFFDKPLITWSFINRDSNTDGGSVTLEFVDDKAFSADKDIASQIARITGSEYNWSSFNDEAYLFSQTLFRATPHINRMYPITKVVFTNTPFPTHLPSEFDIVVYPPIPKYDDESYPLPVTCKCNTWTHAQELFCDALDKLHIAMTPSSVAFKCVGFEMYLLPDEASPVSKCTFVRNRLRRNKEIRFVIVPVDDLVLEEPLDIKFEKFSFPKPDKVSVFSSITLQHKLEMNIRSAMNVKVGKRRLFVEAAIYYGGRKISKTKYTPLENMSSDSVTGQHVWDTWISFDLSISQLPRESRVCITLFSKNEPDQQQEVGDNEAQDQSSQDKDSGDEERKRSLSDQQQQTSKNIEEELQELELLDDSQKIPIMWTSFRIFDHRTRLISGTHSLQLLKGKANPIGICVHAMNLHNSAYLKVTFPSGPVIVYPQDEDLPHQAAGAEEKLAPSPDEEAILNQAINSDSLSTLTESDKQLLWKYRYFLKNKPYSIIKILLATNWMDYKVVSEVHKMLKEWELINPIRAIELLDSKFPDTCAREYAVRCISKMSISELDEYMMQLVQALKCETYHSSALARFLLETAINNRLPLGHTLFLMLKAEMHIPEVRERFMLLLKCYLRASGQHRDVIIRQLNLIDALMTVNKTKNFQSLDNFSLGDNFYLPHDPTLCVSRLIIEKCKVLDSARAPLWLSFENADKLSKTPVCVLFKAADDLRQDMLALQTIKLMDKLWEDDGLDMRLTLYKCVALGPAVGMIELVPECTTIADIQKLTGGGVTSAFKEKTIKKWLKLKAGDKETFEKVVETFTYSLAGYCVATYLLGVGDRHNDNIMLCSDGHLFHIDFGHILGNAEKWKGIKRDRAPFVLTPEFAYVMGGKKNQGFLKFSDVACDAYNVIRKYSSTFITLFTMMLYTDIPELRGEEDIYYLKSALNIDKEESEAKTIFKGLIFQSLGTKMTRINNAIHIAVHSHINDAHDANFK